jgi:hypothetical protein
MADVNQRNDFVRTLEEPPLQGGCNIIHYQALINFVEASSPFREPNIALRELHSINSKSNKVTTLAYQQVMTTVSKPE